MRYFVNDIEMTTEKIRELTLEERTAIAVMQTKRDAIIALKGTSYTLTCISTAFKALQNNEVPNFANLDMPTIEADIVPTLEEFARIHFPSVRVTCKPD